MLRYNRFKIRLLSVPLIWICLFLVRSVVAQELIVLRENDQEIFYEYTNSDSSFVAPYFFVIPQSAQIEVESIESVSIPIKSSNTLERLRLLNNDYSGNSFIEYSGIGYIKGESIRDVLIHTAITEVGASEQLRLLKNIRFSVPKFNRNKRSIELKSSIATNSTLSQTFSNLSPFSDGTWLKIPILEGGVYRIDATYIENAGLSLSEIQPSKISMWSGSHRMLPLQNNEARYQLSQIPISIENATSSFDSASSILFYAQGASGAKLSSDQQLIHERHYFSDTTFVFLCVDGSFEPKNFEQSQLSGGRLINSVEQIRWKEEELFKSEEDLKSGMNWLGQRFTNDLGLRQQEIYNEEISALQNGTELNIEIKSVVRSESSSQMAYLLGDQTIGQSIFSSIRSYTAADGPSATEKTISLRTIYQGSDNILRLQAIASLNLNSAQAWIDYIRIRYRAPLVADNGFLEFFAPVNESGLLRYNANGFTENEPFAFDITNPMNPVAIEGDYNAGRFSFSANKRDRQSFVIQQTPFTPLAAQRIQNQNLRGIQTYPRLIIITNDRLLNSAEDYLSYRNETNPELNGLVVTQQQIFNEYSSGALDVVAIRDFLRHLNAKAIQSSRIGPEYLLLFGDATFDYKQIEGSSEYVNQVITFQTQESLHRIGSYGSDDFFGLLDDNEGDMSDNSERVDLGIGRFPVNSPSEARLLLEKIKYYESPESLGAWRNRFTFLADDELNGNENDGDLHVLNADGTVIRMQTESNGIQFNKIYLPSYPVVVTAEGRRVPTAKSDLLRAINNGSLVINYSGHGAEQLLTAERVFRSEDIPSLSNRDYPTIFVTATCSFGRYDDDLDQSGAEKLLLHNNGGAIASFTTTRVVYTSSSATGATNFSLNIDLSRNMIRRNADGDALRLGDIYRLTKSTQNGAEINSRKFILLGDPIMKIGLGEKQALIGSLNNQSATDTTLVFRGLDELNIAGNIQNAPNFEGEINVEVFDAPRTVRMLGRVNEERPCLLDDCSYEMQNDLLFRGRATVNSGQYQLKFLLPKDIQNAESNGRISLYAQSSDLNLSASGSTNNIRFSGLNLNATNDVEGPKIAAWLNDPFFSNGSIVNPNPILYLQLEDPSGINTTGSGVGHELSASLNTEPPLNFDLNQYFVGDLDDFSSGKIEFPLQDLPEGNHTLTVRAWDVHNNLSETELAFEVLNDGDLVVRNLFNYPNPMSRFTRFIFEHNQTGNSLKVQIRVFTLSGQPVTRLEKEWVPQGNYASIEWNGRDIDGNAVANGTYLYHAIVKSQDQRYEKIEKLVLIR